MQSEGMAAVVNPCHQHFLLSVFVVFQTGSNVFGLAKAVLHRDLKTIFTYPIIMDILTFCSLPSACFSPGFITSL